MINSAPDIDATVHTGGTAATAPPRGGPGNLAAALHRTLDDLREAHYTDPGLAASLARHAVDLARRRGDTGLLADALAAAAHVYATRDEVSRCYRHALEAQHLFEAQGRMAGMGRMLNLRGFCFDAAGDAARALHLHGESLAMLEQAGDASYIPRVLDSIGAVELRRGDYPRAIGYMTDAVRRGAALPRTPVHAIHVCRLAEARVAYGVALRERGNPDEARRHIDEALLLLAEVEAASFDVEPIGVRAVCTNVASRLYLLLGDIERGRRYTMRMWAVATQFGLQNYIAVAFARFCELRGMRGRITKACRWRQRAEERFERLQMKNELRDMLERLSTIAAGHGDMHYAMTFFKRALQLRKETRTAGAAVRAQLLALDHEAEQQRRQMREALIHVGKMSLVGSLATTLNRDLKGPLADADVQARALTATLRRGDVDATVRGLVALLASVDQLRAVVRRLDVFCRKDAGACGVVALDAAMTQVMWIVGARHGRAAHCIRLAVDAVTVWSNADRLVLIVVNVIDYVLNRYGEGIGVIEIASSRSGDGVDLFVSFDGDVVDGGLLDQAPDSVARAAPGLELIIAAEAARTIRTRVTSTVNAFGRAEYRLHLPCRKPGGDVPEEHGGEPDARGIMAT
ncbi:hypothetical protein [Burkholderia sp. GS2Y]|uniref:Uncharacterized protein n=1 Tax=Burkholderia theae TaxID=3143496 RepID=A0ABU9WI79_9BURK